LEVQFDVVMGNNVAGDNKGVNDYITRYHRAVAVTPRPYHHGNLRAALLAEAERMLSEDGAGELSLRELARQIGVSHAAPRRHFADKQALLDALAEEGFERFGAVIRDAVAGAGPGFDARLRAFAHAYVGFATEHAALLELMFAGKHRPGAAPSLRAAADRAFEVPLALIADAQAGEEVVPGDPERVATVAWAALQGLVTMANSGMLEHAALGDMVDAAVERLVLGLRPR
jgi:AcrR family transcriptional regulator